MNVEKILKKLNVLSINGKIDFEIKGISADSRTITPESCFIALSGLKNDGHNFIESAVKKGAILVIAEKEPNNKISVPYIIVDDSRKALSIMFSEFYENPSSFLKVIGVTGTDGKTSITYFTEAALSGCGKRTGVIGTVSYRFLDMEIKSNLTTPDPPELQKILHTMKEKKVEYVAMEVSSHSIHQKRIAGIEFSAGIFTNLGRDHLDYHKTIEDYAMTKRAFFFDYVLNSPKMKGCVFNIDDEFGSKMASEFPANKLTVSLKNENADIFPINYECTITGTTAKIKILDEIISFKTHFIGSHNLTNIMSVLGTLKLLGEDIEKALKGIENLKKISGRLEKIENNLGINIFVDYSHTPNSLEKILKILSELNKGRLITVMGCGGNRDKLKRPLMGKIGFLLSDILFVTSDNPRDEEPNDIINDIMKGVEEVANGKKLVIVEKDRELAIKKSIEIAKKGDLILIAGKGHEQYQIIKNQKLPFSDVEKATKWIKVKEEMGKK